MYKCDLMISRTEDGFIHIGYEDLNVSVFGGGDYEVIYRFDETNYKKLLENLPKTTKTHTVDRLLEIFGERFDEEEFRKFCEKHDIKYKFWNMVH
ncbi:MAG: hypothetical protein GXY89_00815 [Tissierellia bacterium]|nr:hypothetical protein [Tissierellia bacterium]